MKVETIVSLALLGAANAFAPSPIQQRQSTQLKFGIPTFGAGKDKEEKETAASTSNEPEKKINFSGLVQLITAGMGSPFLGNFEGVDEETGKMMFSLEANNLVDEVSIVHSVGILQHSTWYRSRTDEYRIQNEYVFSIYFISCHFNKRIRMLTMRFY